MPNTSPSSTNPADHVDVGSSLAEIDDIMQKRLDDERQAAERTARLDSERSKFAAEFAAACDTDIRPSMEAVLARLRSDGGGGVVVEQPEDAAHDHKHRLTLWMSLSGEISGTPRQDRDPYLQLEAEMDKQRVAVSAGDMWQGHGGNTSGPVGERELSEITPAFVSQEAVAIIRRSVG